MNIAPAEAPSKSQPWLAVLAVLALLLVVASVFGELASRWPLEGSVYA